MRASDVRAVVAKVVERVEGVTVAATAKRMLATVTMVMGDREVAMMAVVSGKAKTVVADEVARMVVLLVVKAVMVVMVVKKVEQWSA